ncbi:hypothetical protein N7478_007651 [Penicillium angulare]|uniref:uncharacterized protein n=1 Tax=Penicillium angulare TaxID=116970 RepID=UPI0025411922|nr:uncharacterized protein N7478_007651 [Penicillium angulare]KAJ5272526.1 hypothetical protein N7478_007651 [Penicillium angulare]
MSDEQPESAHDQAERAGSPVASDPPQATGIATDKEQHEEQDSAEKDHSPQHDQSEEEGEQEEEQEEGEEEETAAPPLPDEVPPPLPDEAPPGQTTDDGWEPVWDANVQAYYFYNRFTTLSQWDNPRIPQSEPTAAAPGTESKPQDQPPLPQKSPVLGGYNPAIHGDYDPTASYAQQYEEQKDPNASSVDPTAAYGATGTFNRFTGRWQADSINPDNHNDANKSQRQMNAFFDVDSAANSHDGRSLRAERSAKKLSKKELKQFKEKRREKKEEKRRAWLRD